MAMKYGKHGSKGYGPGPKSGGSGNGGGKMKPQMSYGKNANVTESKAKTFAGKSGGY